MQRKLAVLLTIVLVTSAFAPLAAAGEPTETDASERLGSTSAAQAECEYPAEFTDATGETLSLEQAPDSVVALQPSDAQTMFEIGAEDRLTGMPENPATADLEMGDREAMTDGYDVLVEQVVALDPDLVLAANTTEDGDVDQLQEAGLDVYVFGEGNSIDDVRENVLTTGELVGECDGANQTVEWMDERIELLENATADDTEDRPLAFYDMRGGSTTGTNSFQHEVLTTAGVENLAERVGLERSWGEIDSEQIVEEDPEWIIHPTGEEGEFPFSAGVENTTAYAESNVMAVDNNAMSQPAPRVVFAIEEIVQNIYPDSYAEIEADLANIDDEQRVYDPSEPGDSTEDDGGEPNDDGESIPGFGVPVAVAALLAVSAFALRRR
ncbi:PGF-CTERM-anchored ABC transporter substrate-binding protein [Halostagnicola larsenii]|nr:PGF-CTERM-anchored ABC transporter substrate-binding protein [Halostagnicola larsenii]